MKNKYKLVLINYMHNCIPSYNASKTHLNLYSRLFFNKEAKDCSIFINSFQQLLEFIKDIDPSKVAPQGVDVE